MNGRVGRGRSRRCAVTLVELLVAMGIAVIIVAITLDILVTTNQTAERVMARGALLQNAELTMREIRAVLDGVVWPADMDTSPPADTSVAFAHDSLAVFSTYNATTGSLFCHYAIGYRSENPLGKATPGFLRQEVGKNLVRFRPLGGDYDASIAFRYATEIGRDLEPVWKESLRPGERPRLVWVEVVLSDPGHLDREGKAEQVRLETALSL